MNQIHQSSRAHRDRVLPRFHRKRRNSAGRSLHVLTGMARKRQGQGGNQEDCDSASPHTLWGDLREGRFLGRVRVTGTSVTAHWLEKWAFRCPAPCSCWGLDCLIHLTQTHEGMEITTWLPGTHGPLMEIFISHCSPLPPRGRGLEGNVPREAWGMTLI